MNSHSLVLLLAANVNVCIVFVCQAWRREGLSRLWMRSVKWFTMRAVKTLWSWSTEGSAATSSSVPVSGNSSRLDLEGEGTEASSCLAEKCCFVPGREGHHQNIENLNQAQTKHDKLADCLGITGEKKYVYDGVSGPFSVQFCLRARLHEDGFL